MGLQIHEGVGGRSVDKEARVYPRVCIGACGDYTACSTVTQRAQ